MALFAVEITYTALVEGIDMANAYAVARRFRADIAAQAEADIDVCGRVTSLRTARRYDYEPDALVYSDRQITVSAALETP